MKINRIVSIYFSPGGSTKTICQTVANALVLPVVELDRTPFENRWNGMILGPNDLAVIAVPCYSGRAPGIMTEFFRKIEGNGAPAVLLASYGNRDYEDTLVELQDLAAKRGFVPVAAAAVSAQHSFSHKLAAGHPTPSDLALLADFAKQVQARLDAVEDCTKLFLDVKGTRPYRAVTDMPTKPSTSSNCIQCMHCQKNCPVQAISPDDATEIDGWRCLLCARCVKLCPTDAKEIAIPALKEKIAVMEAMLTQVKEPQLFFAQAE